MRRIISPAKQMRVDTDSFACKGLPVFMDRTKVLMKWIQSLSYEEQKKLWVCNDKIARQNAERFAHMDLQHNLTPALLAYDVLRLGKDGKPTKSLIRSTYLIDEDGVIVKSFGGVKPKENAAQMLGELE